MKQTTILLSMLFVFAGFGCRKCYDCKVNTDTGEVTRTICGKKKEVSPLITHLESDTTGNGPWVCD